MLDASLAAVPQATVTLVSETTGVTQKSATADSGVYAFPSIPAGTYTIRVTIGSGRPRLLSDTSNQI